MGNQSTIDKTALAMLDEAMQYVMKHGTNPIGNTNNQNAGLLLKHNGIEFRMKTELPQNEYHLRIKIGKDLAVWAVRTEPPNLIAIPFELNQISGSNGQWDIRKINPTYIKEIANGLCEILYFYNR